MFKRYLLQTFPLTDHYMDDRIHLSSVCACVRHVPALSAQVRLWPAVGQGRGIMKYKILSPHCATGILHTCWSVPHFGSQIRPLQASGALKNCLGPMLV